MNGTKSFQISYIKRERSSFLISTFGITNLSDGNDKNGV